MIFSIFLSAARLEVELLQCFLLDQGANSLEAKTALELSSKAT
jgi:hypothetical protein